MKIKMKMIVRFLDLLFWKCTNAFVQYSIIDLFLKFYNINYINIFILIYDICDKLIVGFAVPVELSGRILVYGQNFQFQYVLPQNATFFTKFFEDAPSSRRRRESVSWDERMTIYRLLEEEYERLESFLYIHTLQKMILAMTAWKFTMLFTCRCIRFQVTD